MIGENGHATLEALSRLRAELFDPTCGGHRGKVVKRMHGGWLVEFASATDAVSCALPIQDRLAEHPMVRLRTGILIGAIAHEDEEIFGDGANIAARLETLTDRARSPFPMRSMEVSMAP